MTNAVVEFKPTNQLAVENSLGKRLWTYLKTDNRMNESINQSINYTKDHLGVKSQLTGIYVFMLQNNTFFCEWGK
jgi:hypothetical protein